MSVILKADGKRIVLVAAASALIVAFGYAIYSSIPNSIFVRWFFLFIPILFSINAILSVMRRRIIVSPEGVFVVRCYSKVWVPISEIAGWKIKENHRNPSFHLVTRSGKRIEEFRVGMLGVSNLGKISIKIAKEFAESGRSIENYQE